MLLNVYQIAVMPLNLGTIFILSVIYVDPVPAPEGHPDPVGYERKQKLFLYGTFALFCFLLAFFVSVAVVLVRI